MRLRTLRKIVSEKPIQFDKNDKYKVKFVRLMAGVPTVVKTKKIKKFALDVSEHGMTYPIDFNKPSYRQKNTYFYMFDIDRGQIFYEQSKRVVSPSLSNLILKKAGIQQLIAGMEKKKLGEIVIYIILAILLGVCAGYIAGNAMPMG